MVTSGSGLMARLRDTASAGWGEGCNVRWELCVELDVQPI